MRITRFGHSCLLIEEGMARVLIDPGAWSDVPDDVGDLSAICYTHEHADHVDPKVLTRVLEKQKNVAIYANSGAARVLSERNMNSNLIEDNTKFEVAGLEIQGVGNEHAILHHEWPKCANTGLLINSRFFYPGDALTLPPVQVEILALPVAGPWVRVGEAIDYCLQVKPRFAFPVHDGMLKDDRLGSAHRLPAEILPKYGIEFSALLPGQSIEI